MRAGAMINEEASLIVDHINKKPLKEEPASHVEGAIDLSGLREKSIIENQRLFENNPFYKSVGKFRNMEESVDDLLKETLKEMERVNEIHIETIDREPFVKSENDVKTEIVQECESLFSSSNFSCIPEVYMNLTFEESNCVKSLVLDTQGGHQKKILDIW